MADYDGEARQIAVRGLGRDKPTLFLTNNFDVPARQLITNYARRNGIEDAAFGNSVNFFHLDCLSSEVQLNVDLDTVLTVLANGCYRWLASQLHGFDQTKPKAALPQVRGNFRHGGNRRPPTHRRLLPLTQPQPHPPRSAARQRLLRDSLVTQSPPGVCIHLILQLSSN